MCCSVLQQSLADDDRQLTKWLSLERPRLSAKCAVCCSVLQCVAMCCIVLHCAAVCCSVLQCVAVCCSLLQCVAVCSSVLQRVADDDKQLVETAQVREGKTVGRVYCVLQCVAMCCNVCAVCGLSVCCLSSICLLVHSLTLSREHVRAPSSPFLPIPCLVLCNAHTAGRTYTHIHIHTYAHIPPCQKNSSRGAHMKLMV